MGARSGVSRRCLLRIRVNARAKNATIVGMFRRRAIGALAIAVAPTLLATACASSGSPSSPTSITPVTKTVTASPSAGTSTATAPAGTVDPQAFHAVSEGMEGYYFVTPSGKWRCAIVVRLNVAGCQPSDNHQPSIGVAGAPVTVPGPINGAPVAPNAIRVQRGSDPEFAYRGQAEFWHFPLETTRVLPYGQTLSADQFECNVKESGVSCKDTTTGKGFTFSDADFSWNYTPATGDAAVGGGTQTAAPATQFAGQWTGHGRQLDLNSGGNAVVSIFSGAANGTYWDATWSQSDTTLTITFGNVTRLTGDGGMTIARGTVWTGRMTTAEGVRVLEISALPGIYWCRDGDNATGVCGA